MIFPLSGGGAKLFAAISVTYPEGSILTCTKADNSKTFTAEDTNGQWVFTIPEIGTWIVTATQGTNTKSESVSITTEGQFESVELKYELALFNKGVVDSAIGNLVGSGASADYGGASYNIGEETIRLYAESGYGSSHALVGLENSIDVTEFNTLKFNVTSLTFHDSASLILGLSKNSLNHYDFIVSASPTVAEAIEIDVSEINGFFWPVATVRASWNSAWQKRAEITAEIDKIALE